MLGVLCLSIPITLGQDSLVREWCEGEVVKTDDKSKELE